MKTTLHLFSFALCLPFLIIFCSPDDGFTSSFATNYEKSASENCCFTYDVEDIVADLVGSYSYDSERCKSLEDPEVENGVIMTNLNNYDEIEVPGVFVDGEIKF
jgi:hypothetical protein